MVSRSEENEFFSTDSITKYFAVGSDCGNFLKWNILKILVQPTKAIPFTFVFWEVKIISVILFYLVFVSLGALVAVTSCSYRVLI